MCSLSGKIKQIAALKDGNGLPYLVNAGGKILGNPVCIHDMDYKLLAHTEHIRTDDTLWNELTGGGVYSRETLELFKAEYFIDAIANAETVAFLTSAKLKYNRMLGKILYQERFMVACTNIIACLKPFTDDDLPVFEALCQKIAREISGSNFYRGYGEQRQEAVINELIDGRVKDKRLHSHSVAEIYQGLRNYIYIAVADKAPEHFISIIKQWQPAFKYARRDGRTVIIFSADNIDPDDNDDLQKLQMLADEHEVRLGISDGFENLFTAQAYYEQASAALLE